MPSAIAFSTLTDEALPRSFLEEVGFRSPVPWLVIGGFWAARLRLSCTFSRTDSRHAAKELGVLSGLGVLLLVGAWLTVDCTAIC